MKKNKILIIILLIIIAFVLYFIFSLLLTKETKDYNYEVLIGNSYIADDNSYLVLNNDKTFYWYKDINNKDEYYYGIYTIFRGENAVKYISSELAIYSISEEKQRNKIKESSIENAIDHYFNLNLNNEKYVVNGKEERMYKETRYYGFASSNYEELIFFNMNTGQKAIFKYDK